MIERPECRLCGLPLDNWTPTVWRDGDPYCGDGCARLAAVCGPGPGGA